MALQWIQEARFSARGVTGTYYKVFPFSGGSSDKYAAVVTFLDESASQQTRPIGGQFDTIEEAKEACEKEMLRATQEVKV